MRIKKTVSALLLAIALCASGVWPAVADDGYMDSDSVTKIDSLLGSCIQYGANLFGNTLIHTGYNSNLTTYYSTTAAEKRAEGVILHGTAYIPEARYEKVVVEWSDFWSGGFGTPYEIGLATSQSVYTNKDANNSKPTHQVLAMAWDLLWNWLGSYSSTFSVLPSPSGLLATPPGTVWSDGGGTWDESDRVAKFYCLDAKRYGQVGFSYPWRPKERQD